MRGGLRRVVAGPVATARRLAASDVLFAETARLRERVATLEAPLLDAEAQRRAVDSLAALLEPRPIAQGFRRLGRDRDGGYVVADLTLPDAVVSIGVGDECSADVDLADGGATVWQFDHTVPRSPAAHARIRFEPRGLGGADASPPRYRLASLVDQVVRTAERTWLLIDVEGDEWPMLADPATELASFEQIVIELHGLSAIAEPRAAPEILRGLARLVDAHVPVALHGNNCAPVHVIGRRWVPDVLEVSLIRCDAVRPGHGRPPASLFRSNDPRGAELPGSPLAPVDRRWGPWPWA